MTRVKRWQLVLMCVATVLVATEVFAQREPVLDPDPRTLMMGGNREIRSISHQPRPTAPIVVYAGASDVPLDRLRFATPEQHVYRLLLGDLRVLPFIENADVSIVPVLEGALKQVTGVTIDDVDALVRQLSASSWSEREHASWRLLGAPAEADELLQRYMHETGSPEVRHRLSSVLAVRKECAPGFLAAAKLLAIKYQQHTDALFHERWRRLETDPRDVDAMAYFAYAPFDSLWARIQAYPHDTQLRFLLLRVYAERRGREVDEVLRKHPAGAVMRMARQTYWPIVIEPVQLDGTFGWTTLAGSVQGNVVHDIIRLSLKTADFPKPDERGQWVNLVAWQRWTCIFRFAKPWHNKNAVVFTERRGASELPFGQGDRPPAQGQPDTVRGWPEQVNVPYATITERESTDWHHLRAYEWARPLFPEPMRQRIRFRENVHEVPKVMPADALDATDRASAESR